MIVLTPAQALQALDEAGVPLDCRPAPTETLCMWWMTQLDGLPNWLEDGETHTGFVLAIVGPECAESFWTGEEWYPV